MSRDRSRLTLLLSYRGERCPPRSSRRELPARETAAPPSPRPLPTAAKRASPVRRWPPRGTLFVMLCVVLAAFAFGPFHAEPAGAAEIAVPFEWYRYQGEPDSGPDALQNCEVTTTAMAIQFARGGLRIPIQDVRAVIGRSGPTTSADAKKALRYWGVPTSDIDNIDQVIAAVRRGRIVIVGLMMGAISIGTDAGQARSSPRERTGRYSTYAGAHSIIVKGVSADGQWLTVYDPNHWDTNPIYFYADGTPKGKNRLYKTSEVAAGMRALVDFPRAIEILGGSGVLTNGGQAPATPTPAVSATPPAGKAAPKQSGDLVVLTSGAGGSWSSAVVTFGVKNDGTAPIHFEAIGIRGVRPDGKPFDQLQRQLSLKPGEERVVSLLLATPATGEWRISGIVYQHDGAWHDLPPEGKVSRAAFRVGGAAGMPPLPAPTAAAGVKPSAPLQPGS
ncbi:MAG: hypothetical protein RMM58_12365 [Chloroflexota bacterium]|nr:hypothetical protein [Dehalococcoidia bacterium]MDW8254662.1 hypothetical protein [Chloroflexota bacterium]